jgi:hypothetical protein
MASVIGCGKRNASRLMPPEREPRRGVFSTTAATTVEQENKPMLKTLTIAGSLAISVIGATTAPAMADGYCGPGFYFSRHWGECRPYGYRPYAYYGPPGVVGGTVAGAGYVAGSAVNAAGNVAGAAIGTAGAIVGGVLGR